MTHTFLQMIQSILKLAGTMNESLYKQTAITMLNL